MKILYVANVRMPTEKAHGIQIMKMCEAFAKQDNLAALLVPKRKTPITESPFSYYGIHTEFPIKFLPTIDEVRWGSLGFLLQTYTFTQSVKKILKNYSGAVIYGRDERVLWELMKKGPQRSFVWETHTGAWNSAARRVATRATYVVAISQGLKDFYVSKGISSEKIIVAHDAIDLAAFSNPETKEQARMRLSLPVNKKIALYIGRVDGWKGVDVLGKASEFLPEDILVVVIGGEVAQLSELKKLYPRVTFLGPRPYTELVHNQAAGDVLVLPNTGTNEISARFTSPLKLFSYMAGNRPIVASDLPSIREVLDDTCAYFAIPDDPHSFSKQIQIALTDSEAVEKVFRSRARVEEYTWDARAERIKITLCI